MRALTAASPGPSGDAAFTTNRAVGAPLGVNRAVRVVSVSTTRSWEAAPRATELSNPHPSAPSSWGDGAAIELREPSITSSS